MRGEIAIVLLLGLTLLAPGCVKKEPADDDSGDDDTADDDTADDDTADDDTGDDDTGDDDTADDDIADDDDGARGCECEGSEDALTAPAAPVPLGMLVGASLWFRIRRRR